MENQGEGCRRPLRPFLASLLLRLLPPPSTPSPAAHPSLRRTITEGKGGHPVRFWSMSSPHLASNQKGSDSGCRSTSQPRPRPRLSSPLPGGEGRATSQPWRAIPSSSPRRPSPPCRGGPTAHRLALMEVWRAYSTDPDELTLSQAT